MKRKTTYTPLQLSLVLLLCLLLPCAAWAEEFYEEMPELLRMSDRIVVMCEGVKTGELSIEEASQEKIIDLQDKKQKEKLL